MTTKVTRNLIEGLQISDVDGLSAALGRFTDWVAYTPIFTGFGTVTDVNIFSRRVGDTLHVRGSFVSGTPTAVNAQMTLGFDGSSGGVFADSAKVPVLQMAGPLLRSVAVTHSWYALISGGRGYLTFGVQSGSVSGYTEANASAIAANGNTLTLTAEVPISGWGA